ncbi:MAG TPA: molybdopterin-dependent oxidoreductase [Nocardioides sp.]|uniref:molybdopterin-dependent oxidoreductase n=1 Tax=Nocardioides sp. TaxID=35761 RepID=UPI002BCBF1C5|nr:molybdopterin cofactor-binding domain-containing protein [Nocardioides sp.]HQR27669.1 molybdopterin-dependent oxidoreductase [Nocardioides sp.]
MRDIELTLNGVRTQVSCAPGDSLLTVLRRLGCVSVRYGSETGETGAAAVLVDGRLLAADVLLAAQVDGHEVTTVEALDVATGELHPIQAAFVESGALQSGYSAGAMVLATKALVERTPDPTEWQIRDAFSGILDRETGYVKVVDAVKRAAALLRGEKPEPMAPVLVEPLGDGPGGPPPDAPSAMPRLVPSPDVPPTTVVGQSPPKVDAVKLVKGRPAFVDDVVPRGMLYAKVLRSPHAHARIVAIDDSEATALPGVHAVLHTFNTPRVKYASGGQSWPNPHPWDQVSFDDKVRHVGDRVAAVAAESLDLAEEACRRIRVTYEVLPAVFDELEAIAPGAPVIHDETDTEGIHDAQRNISHHIGGQTVPDERLDAAFAAAEHVFEQTFRVQQQQQCPIEPHITIGWLDSDERLVLRTSTQVPFHVRRMVAPLLGLPVKRIRVVKPRIGGGFGGKQEMLLEDVVGHLVLATRRPVRLELTREEEFVSSRIRHAQTLTFRTAVDGEGRLLAQDLRVVGNTGPYATHGFTVQSVTGQRGLSEYNSPAKRYTADVAYTNRPVAGAFRGYGAPQALFALESHMDDIARGLGLDPIELRRRNWVRTGDPLDILPQLGERGATEIAPEDMPRVTSCATDECVAQARRAIGWERRTDPAWRQPPDRPHVRRGIGFALCMQATAIPNLDMGGCSLKMNDDGSFNLLVGATDLGTGADTVLAQIAAEVLGVQVDDVLVYAADTDLTPFDVGAYADSTTYISGMAVKKAAEQVRERIALRAARLLGLEDAGEVVLRAGHAWSRDGRSVSLGEVALNALHVEDQEQIMATASHVSAESPPPFAAQFAEVEVDTEAGQVTVGRLVMAVDCGVAINPTTASGQVEGAMVQALGYALTEELVLDEAGRAVNARFGPYWIFRPDDTPPMEVYLVQTMEASGPFGAKSVGEIAIDGVAPAVRNAILDATGVAVNELPLTPERVWRALHPQPAG